MWCKFGPVLNSHQSSPNFGNALDNTSGRVPSPKWSSSGPKSRYRGISGWKGDTGEPGGRSGTRSIPPKTRANLNTCDSMLVLYRLSQGRCCYHHLFSWSQKSKIRLLFWNWKNMDVFLLDSDFFQQMQLLLKVVQTIIMWNDSERGYSFSFKWWRINLMLITSLI